MSIVRVNLAKRGKRNLTAIGMSRKLSDESLDRLARAVAIRPPGAYYIIDAKTRTIYYRWHVGEGFSHSEGWWIESR